MTNLELVLSKLTVVKQRGNVYEVKCPAHSDKRASLGVWLNDSGWVSFRDQAGCEREAILEAIGLRVCDIGPPRSGERKEREIVKCYDYTTETGEVLYQVVRLEPKAFLQRTPREDGTWFWRKGPAQVLYRLADIAEHRRRLNDEARKT